MPNRTAVSSTASKKMTERFGSGVTCVSSFPVTTAAATASVA